MMSALSWEQVAHSRFCDAASAASRTPTLFRKFNGTALVQHQLLSCSSTIAVCFACNYQCNQSTQRWLHALSLQSSNLE